MGWSGEIDINRVDDSFEGKYQEGVTYGFMKENKLMYYNYPSVVDGVVQKEEYDKFCEIENAYVDYVMSLLE